MSKLRGKKELWGDNEHESFRWMPEKCTRKHNAQDIWFILACLCPCYFFWIFLGCFVHCFHVSLHPSSETSSLLRIGYILKLIPGWTKRTETCWVLRQAGAMLQHGQSQLFTGCPGRWVLAQHPQAPTRPAGLRLGGCIGSGWVGERAGNSWLCTPTVRISLLEQGELRFSQLAGVYKYWWHSLHYYFSWAVNIRLLIVG